MSFDSNVREKRPTTKCLSHGADKAHFLIFVVALRLNITLGIIRLSRGQSLDTSFC